MIVLEKLRNTFNFLFWLYFILCIKKSNDIVISVMKKHSHECDTIKDEDCMEKSDSILWKYLVKILILFSMPGIVYVIIMLIFLKQKDNHIIYCFIVLMAIPGYIKGALSIMKPFTTIKKIISTSDNNNLSFQEQINFIVFGPVMMVLERLNIFKILANKCSMINNCYLSDFFIALIYIIIYCIYIFFICLLFIIPAISIANFVRKILNMVITNNKLKEVEEYWIKQIDRDIELNVDSLFINRCEKREKEKSFCVKHFLVLPLFLILDIFNRFIKETTCIIGEIIGYFFIIIQLLMNWFKNFLDWILTFSDKKIINIALRTTIIIAFLCVIVLNRYQPIFKRQEQSTEILEFVASTIIIPIVLEWIISIKKDSTT